MNVDPPAGPAEVRIYRPQAPEGYEWALPEDQADFETLRAVDTGWSSAPWTAPRMHLVRSDDRGRARMHADMPLLSSNALVLRDEAIEAVGPLLAPYGELLSLRAPDARLALFRARQLSGALDEGRSDLVPFSSGRIMDLRAPMFHPSVVATAGAFVLAEMPRGHMYLTGELVDAIRSTGRTSGTDFRLVFETSARGI